MINLALAFVLFFALPSHANPAAVTVDLALSPAGKFQAKTAAVKGEAILDGDTVVAKNISVDLRSLKTGIELRDEHTQKYLESEKFPEAVLLSAKGKDGKGEGILKVHGVEKPVNGTYAIKGNELHADFDFKISDFNITGVRYMGLGLKDLGKIHVIIPLVKKAGPAH